MSARSNAEIAMRSFAPAEELIAARDAEALNVQYLCAAHPELDGRQKILDDPKQWEIAPEPPLAEYSSYKRVGCLAVESGGASRFAAIDMNDPSYMVAPHQEGLVNLHIGPFAGAGELRRDVSRAAEFISMHEALRSAPMVVGATSTRFTGFARRAGMREMQYWGAGNGFIESTHCWHRVFNAINGRNDPFSIGVVYLPTAEFIEKFKS
ncbi:MAG TPA: hypothetical protein VLF62_00135 [Candidatus Saccharimonadales bacterium]|nr:hypothetical protein [Candidatus Saccharimonadales bacterium]